MISIKPVKMYDVIVIGSGPAGSLCARMLGERSYDVLLLEGRGKVRKAKNCSGIIGVEAFEKFDLPKSPILGVLNSVKFYSPKGSCLKYDPNRVLAYIMDRGRFDYMMLQRAESVIDFREHSQVEDIEILHDRVKVSVVNCRRNYTINAKTVVIATGYNVALLKRIGLEMPATFLQGAQIEIDIDGLDVTEIYLGHDISPGSFAWAVPLGGGRAKVGLTTGARARAYLKGLLCSPFLKNRVVDLDFSKIRCSPVPLGSTGKSFTDRVLVVGDAAGQVKTTTNGGIYYGMIGAEIATQTLDNAFKKGDLSETELSGYEREWRTRLGKELMVGTALRDIYSKLNDDRIEMLLKFVKKNGVMSFISKRADFDWHQDLLLSLWQKPMMKMLFGI